MWGSTVGLRPVNCFLFFVVSPRRRVSFYAPTGKVFVFLLRSLLCSHWERSCLPIGKGQVFSLGT